MFQMLESIKKKGYWWLLDSEGWIIVGVQGTKGSMPGKKFVSDSPEKAVAEALLWILENTK